MRSQVRRKKLTSTVRARQNAGASSDGSSVAGLRLLETYALLAERGEHFLDGLMHKQAPRQWAHYPENDAVDANSGYQWFYHSHAPEERCGIAEHGHIHLFARRKLWTRRLCSKRERQFAQLRGGTTHPVNTRHLLSIGFDAKGLPISLFTVNSWVTGDLMLSAETTAALLERMALNTGYCHVDTVIESLLNLFKLEVIDLLARRDAVLFGWKDGNVLASASLEVLSEIRIDVDTKLLG